MLYRTTIYQITEEPDGDLPLHLLSTLILVWLDLVLKFSAVPSISGRRTYTKARRHHGGLSITASKRLEFAFLMRVLRSFSGLKLALLVDCDGRLSVFSRPWETRWRWHRNSSLLLIRLSTCRLCPDCVVVISHLGLAVVFT